jgi:hypothetical protein
MLTDRESSDTELRKAVAEMARLLKEIECRVDQANAKLDHLIETYGSEHRCYAPVCPLDPQDEPRYE